MYLQTADKILSDVLCTFSYEQCSSQHILCKSGAQNFIYHDALLEALVQASGRGHCLRLRRRGHRVTGSSSLVPQLYILTYIQPCLAAMNED